MKFSNRCTSLTKAGRRCKNHKKQGQEVCGIHYKMETKYDFCLDLLFNDEAQHEQIAETPVSTPVSETPNYLEEIAKCVLVLENCDSEDDEDWAMGHGTWGEEMPPFVQTITIDDIFSQVTRKLAIRKAIK